MPTKKPPDAEEEPTSVDLKLGSIKKWVTGWTVTTVLVPSLLLLVGLRLAAHWNRPQLSISMAKALIGSNRVLRNNRVHEYRAVLDLQRKCLMWLVEYSAPNDGTLPPAVKPVYPRVVYGIYLENLGRSTLTDIRLTFSTPKGSDFEVTGSPQLSLTQGQQTDPNAEPIRAVTIASLAPGASGVVMAVLPAPGGVVSVVPTSEAAGEINFDVSLSVKQINRSPNKHSHFQFAGTREVSAVPLKVMSVDDLFTRQQAVFGLDALPLPIDAIEISATAENFKLRGPFHVCPMSGMAAFSAPVFRRPD